MKKNTLLYWLLGGVTLIAGGTAIYFATRTPKTTSATKSNTLVPPPADGKSVMASTSVDATPTVDSTPTPTPEPPPQITQLQNLSQII